MISYRLKRLALYCFAALFLPGILLLFSGCTFHSRESSVSLFAMDTSMTIRFLGENDALLQEMQETVRRIEREVSVTRDGSDLQLLNQEGKAVLSGETQTVLSEALELCAETGGALDISVYPLVRAWGFTTDHTRVPSPEEIHTLLPLVDYRRISLNGCNAALPDGMAIDLGSVTKGYTGRVLAEMLKGAHIRSAILDLGGNVQAVGFRPDGTPWRIGIRSPEGEALLGVAEVHDEAVITSGGYERFFTDPEGSIWWHILDPATGYPARNGLLSVTIVGKDGLRCDALSTALFVMGRERAVSFWQEKQDFEMILVTDDGQLFITPALRRRFTPDPSLPYSVQEIIP